MIDLHTHTTASDGTFSPGGLVRLAAEKGLTALAVTDHDTTDGIAAARYQAEKSGVAFASVIDALLFLKDARKERNPKIIERLNDAGVPITLNDVLAESGGGEVGRPHFARALVKKGHVKTIADAFERYLAKGASCYVDKKRLSPADAVDLIRRAGGVPALAHPGSLNLSPEELARTVEELAGWGLMGIECYYYNHTPQETEGYVALARDFGLVPTGGTDFHGKNRPKIKLGTGTGGLDIPHEVFERLVSLHEGMSSSLLSLRDTHRSSQPR